MLFFTKIKSLFDIKIWKKDNKKTKIINKSNEKNINNFGNINNNFNFKIEKNDIDDYNDELIKFNSKLEKIRKENNGKIKDTDIMWEETKFINIRSNHFIIFIWLQN